MFWPMRFTYSTTTGSVTRCADFSISIEYCLPFDISQLVEYQFPMPRPPMFRVPTAFTSSSLPGLMCGFRFSPGEGSESVFFDAVNGVFPASVAAGVSVPGVDAGGVVEGCAEPTGGWTLVAVPSVLVAAVPGVLVPAVFAGVAAGAVVVAGVAVAGVVAAGTVVVGGAGVCAYRPADSARTAARLTCTG